MNKNTWKSALYGQWPFLWGGVAVGLAGAIYYWLHQRPLNLTFALAHAASKLEDRLGFSNALFNRGYNPELSTVLLGLLAGAAIVALLGRSRHQVTYSMRILAVAFLGGVLSGFGALLAEGDILYHFISGVATMQISSLFITAFAIPFLFVALELLAVLGVADAFQIDAGWNQSEKSDDEPARISVVRRTPLIWGATILALTIFLAAESGQGGLAMLALGGLAGIGIAKSGFGVEWSLLAPDAVASSPRLMWQLGLTTDTVSSLRSYAALRAWLAAVGIISATALVNWIVSGLGTAPSDIAGGTGFHIGHVAGAPLLAMGSVLMLGCDFRTYARLSLGFTSSIAASLGLLVGYVPGALWGGSITSWAESNRISTSSWLPDVISPASPLKIILWFLFVGILVLGFILLRLEEIRGKKS